MSIRFNKALRELNIGIQTAVEFLEKKKDLGEVKSDPNFKLSDEQYSALVEAFKQDADVKTQADKLFVKKPKEKKPKEVEEERAEVLLEKRAQPQFKTLGKIDLDGIGRKPKETPVEKKEVKTVAEPEAAAAESRPKVEKQEEKSVPAVEKQPEEVKAKPKTKPKEEPKPVAEKAPKQEEQQAEVFHLKSEKKILNAPKVNVLGKIDLDSINQSTRPKKKSKEERKKEREEKAAQQHSEKKKRVRINKERVDINDAANQVQQGGGSGKSGKKKKNRGRNQKPLEVNEEDVARQVKETLARLTNKQSQNKKGAKYRKEKREAVQEKMAEEAAAERSESKVLKLTEFVTVSELATMMNIGVTQVISTLMSVGIMVSTL